MANDNTVNNIRLFVNTQDAPLIKLSPDSLPFDDNPTDGSQNLINSGKLKTIKDEIDNQLGRIDTFTQDINASIPVGTIISYIGNDENSTLSGGLQCYIQCNGASVNRENYRELFDVIGTRYGSGDGKTTFNLPNLNNKFLMGSTTAGNAINAGLPNITGVGGFWFTNVGKATKETSCSQLSGAIYVYAPSGLPTPPNSNPDDYRLPYSRGDFMKQITASIAANGGSVKYSYTDTKGKIISGTLTDVNTGTELRHYLQGVLKTNKNIADRMINTDYYYFPAGYTGDAGKRWAHIAPKITQVTNNFRDVNDASTAANAFPLAFDASLSNKIYGSSNTVQPPALTVKFYIRYKLK